MRDRFRTPRTSPPRTFGLVYFLHSHELGRVKIGHTDVDGGRRVIGLRLTNAAIIRPIAYMRGTKAVEDALHDLFAAHRLHGEWFDFVPGIEAFAGSFATAWPDGRHPDSIEVPRHVADRIAAETILAAGRWKDRAPASGPPHRLDWSAGLPRVDRWQRAITRALDGWRPPTEEDIRRKEHEERWREVAELEAARVAKYPWLRSRLLPGPAYCGDHEAANP